MESKMKISFSVKKNQTEKPNDSINVFKDESLKDNLGADIEYIREIEENDIKSIKPSKKADEVVIPLIQSKKPILEKIKVKAEAKESVRLITDELKKEAMEKIIEESKPEAMNGSNSGLVIPMATSSETTIPGEDAADEEIPDADYEAVAVESFGLAMLRGMGSKEEIDSCLSSAPSIPSRRAKGLGLGAQIPKNDGKNGAASSGRSANGTSDQKEELVMKRGTHCCILQGRNSGRYGTIDSIDGNQDRLVVTLATGDKPVITCPTLAVRLVSETEFRKFSKYLNRDKAERVKAEEEARMEEERKKDGERRLQYEREREGTDVESKRRKMEESKVADSGRLTQHSSRRSWVMPKMRVRIVDRKYRSGRHHKEKVVVLKVLPTACVCRTDAGEILDDVWLTALETVIPKTESDSVMVVRGPYKGEVGKIISREARHCEATVQFSGGKRRSLDYDDLCEVVK